MNQDMLPQWEMKCADANRTLLRTLRQKWKSIRQDEDEKGQIVFYDLVDEM